MDFNSASESTWYDKLVEVHIGLAQTTTITGCDLHLQKVYCNELQEKVTDLKNEILKLEDCYDFERSKLNNTLKMEEMLKQNLDSIDDLITTKEFCFQILLQNYEHKQKDVRQNDILASSIAETFEKNYKKSKETFDKCSLAQRYQKLKNDVLGRKIKVAILHKKIEEQKAKNKLRIKIKRKIKQQKIIRFAEVMVEYYSTQKMKTKSKEDKDGKSVQTEKEPQNDTTHSIVDSDQNLVETVDPNVNTTRLNFEDIIKSLQFKINDYTIASKVEAPRSQAPKCAVLQKESFSHLRDIQKRDSEGIASKNIIYNSSHLFNIPAKTFLDQSVNLNTNIATESCAIQKTKTNLSNANLCKNKLPEKNLPDDIMMDVDVIEPSGVDEIKIIVDSEIPANITVSQETQNMDKTTTIDQIQIESSNEPMEEQYKDNTTENEVDFTSPQQDEQSSIMPSTEDTQKNYLGMSTSEEQLEETSDRIDMDMLQYEHIIASYKSNDNGDMMDHTTNIEPEAQRSGSSPSSVLSFCVPNMEQSTDVPVQDVSPNIPNIFATNKPAEPFKLTFGEPSKKASNFFSMF